MQLRIRANETYSTGLAVLTANYQAQSNNKKTIFQAKMKYACNCLKHQNIPKNITFFRLVNLSWDLENAMVNAL